MVGVVVAGDRGGQRINSQVFEIEYDVIATTGINQNGGVAKANDGSVRLADIEKEELQGIPGRGHLLGRDRARKRRREETKPGGGGDAAKKQLGEE
jgi:hypothetical protein